MFGVRSGAGLCGLAPERTPKLSPLQLYYGVKKG